MCGIAGALGGRPLEPEVIVRMGRALAHRGPDDEGLWFDAEAGIGFAHRRLSIIDPSPAGHQPMQSPSGRYVITLNGEIYNYSELRTAILDGGQEIEWRGHSDTEVLLAGFDAWGIRNTLERASGMFAFGVWDKQERRLILARDRMGEKPLYYGRPAGPKRAFLFASELDALRQHPDFEPEVDRHSLSLLVRYLEVPAPFSIYRGVFKLQPGTMLTLYSDRAEPLIEKYWSAAQVVQTGVEDPFVGSEADAADELECVLTRAVGRQMMADVPLGAFLSGGVDSSTVVAMMQKLSRTPVNTFTIGFHESTYNEAGHAKAVAGHLGTKHTELYVSGSQARDVIPRLSTIYDEPFADSSQIPTYLISALARQDVTVALSGDGGDELFGGYDRYLFTTNFWHRIAGIPAPLRAAAARALTMVSATNWTRLGDVASAMAPRSLNVARLGDKLHKAASLLTSESLDELYDRMLVQWRDPAEVVLGITQEPVLGQDPELTRLVGVEGMMARDMLGYLPNDVLVKVDRAAMAASLETRVPLLDPDVVQFAWRLPLHLKIRGNETKWLLRQVLYRHVPAALIERPKMGFAVPLGSWLRGPLREWTEALLDERRLRDDSYFSPREVRRAWEAHVRGEDNEHKLWPILIFQSWLDTRFKSTLVERATRAGAFVVA